MGNKRFKLKKLLLALLIIFCFIGAVVLSVFIYAVIPIDTVAGGYSFSKDMEFDINSGQTMEISNDGLKVLILSDQHYTRVFGDKKTNRLMDFLVGQSEPDLIVLLGDQCFTPFNKGAYTHLIKKMDSYKIPWAPIFGNHDEQGPATKRYLAKMLSESDYCVFQYGPNNIGGAGNYFINISHEGNFVHTLYLMDSTVKKNRDYQPLTKEQVDWYEWAVKGITGYTGKVIPSTLMVHIPLVEYIEGYAAAFSSNSVVYGERREKENPSKINSGMFEKMKALNSTKGVFCGHDHTNSYSVIYDGIRLTYALSSGYGSYGDKDLKGGTLLTIKPDGGTEQNQLYYRA